jgi:hypothetical protein
MHKFATFPPSPNAWPSGAHAEERTCGAAVQRRRAAVDVPRGNDPVRQPISDRVGGLVPFLCREAFRPAAIGEVCSGAPSAALGISLSDVGPSAFGVVGVRIAPHRDLPHGTEKERGVLVSAFGEGHDCRPHGCDVQFALSFVTPTLAPCGLLLSLTRRRGTQIRFPRLTNVRRRGFLAIA